MNHAYYESPYYHTGSSQDAAGVAVLSIYLILLALVLIFGLVSYILHSIGLYTIAGRLGMSNAWLAFIPFARTWLHGELAGEISLKTKKIRNPGVWKLVMPIISGGIFFVFYILFLLISGVGIFLNLSSSGRNDGLSVGTIMGILFFLIIWILIAVLYSAAYQVLCVLINIQIYGRFTSRNMAVVHAVLSALIPLYESICTFVIRNKSFNPGMGPHIPRQPYGMPHSGMTPPPAGQGISPQNFGPGPAGSGPREAEERPFQGASGEPEQNHPVQ